MSSKTKNNVLFNRDGQAQPQRFAEWLNPGKVPLDSRSTKDLLEYIFNISKEVKFFDHENLYEAADESTWQDILNYNCSSFDELYVKLEALKKVKSLPAHFSLLYTFLELYKEPQRLMNTITARHLDFYYKEVLGLKKKAPVPDKAHVVFELKKNTAPYLLKQDTKLLAGKDKFKKDLVYKLTHDIVVNSSKAAQLKSLFINPANKNLLHFAPVANSADGLGAELNKINPSWNAFGYQELPVAQPGFCLAGDVMTMQEGERTITVRLELNGVSAIIRDGSRIDNLFIVSATGAKGWTDVKNISPTVNKSNDKTGELLFSVSFSADDPAIIAYNSDLHGAGYTTNKPVLKILLNPASSVGYEHFKNADLVNGSITVTVKGMKALQLENDFGVLNPKKPFFPFGPTPENDANFWVGSEEVFNKQLLNLQLNIEWKNIPAKKLADHYSGYLTHVENKSFTVNATFRDAAGWNVENDKNNLFDADDATKKDENNVSTKIIFTKNERPKIRVPQLKVDFLPVQLMRSSNKTLAQEISEKISWLKPGWLRSFPMAPFANRTATMPIRVPTKSGFQNPNEFVFASFRKGYLHLALNQGFLFREYRSQFTKQVLDFSKGDNKTINPLKEPFSPEMQTLTLEYSATTGTVSFNENTLNDYSDASIELYHAGPFGQMREHTYARNQSAFLTNKSVKLLPQYYSEGNFYIGLSGLHANDSICLLFQVASGSADPDLPKADLEWEVLCDNYWKSLNTRDFIFDTTNDFLTNGIVKLVIPKEATTENTIMPDGLLWLKVSAAQYSKAVCRLIDVRTNAAIAEFVNNENDPEHLKVQLEAGQVTKLQQMAGAIKKIEQPYASFGGRMEENDTTFYTRVSERLRHKERSVACWDYERLILQHFSSIYKIKCINHSSVTSFTDAGHILIVVIPDLTNQNAVNPFQPRADKNTLDEILQFLKKHAAEWAEHHIINPFYEPVKITVSVKLKAGYEFNYYQEEINKVLQNFLSPWINGSAGDIHFGGKITESHIVKLLEDLEYVDYITGLQLFHSTNGGQSFKLCKQFIETSGPASILVSHTQHEVIQS